jgi:hypothetical protein
MTSTGLGNEVQSRMIAEQVAMAAVERYAQMHPPIAPAARMEVPAPLKWAAAIVSAILTAGAVAMALWVVTTLGNLQQTVTRIDERQRLVGDSTSDRLKMIEERLSRLEQVTREPRG